MNSCESQLFLAFTIRLAFFARGVKPVLTIVGKVSEYSKRVTSIMHIVCKLYVKKSYGFWLSFRYEFAVFDENPSPEMLSFRSRS